MTTAHEPNTAPPLPPPGERVQRIVHGPIVPMLARLAAPNVAVVFAQTAVTVAKVGAVACSLYLLTIATVLIVTRLVAAQGPAALAGFGLGSRLELMVVPIAFGVGGAMTAAVGLNFGAMRHARARRIAWTGGSFVGAVTGLAGIVVAGLFSFGAVIGASLFSRVWRPS